MLHLAVRNVNCPRVTATFPHRHARRRELRICKHAERNGDAPWSGTELPVHGRAATRTELKGHAAPGLNGADVRSARAGDADLFTLEPCLHAKRGARTALTGEAMTHRYSCRLTPAGNAHVATAAACCSLVHRCVSPVPRRCGQRPGHARPILSRHAKPVLVGAGPRESRRDSCSKPMLMPPPSPDLSVPCERGMRCSARSGEREDSFPLTEVRTWTRPGCFGPHSRPDRACLHTHRTPSALQRAALLPWGR
jgi:hypothetical protein